jgi:hypothetical protein
MMSSTSGGTPGPEETVKLRAFGENVGLFNELVRGGYIPVPALDAELVRDLV